MQKLSIRQFSDFLAKLPQYRIIYDSVNQDWCTVGETMKIKHEFDNIKISFNPNTIYLCSYFGTMRFERVKHITMDEPSILGEVFTIVCGDFSSNDNNKSYTIIVA